MLFDLFLFTNLYPNSLILFIFLLLYLIQIFRRFLFLYLVLFLLLRFLIYPVIFVAFIITYHHLPLRLYFILRRMCADLLLVMYDYRLLQWLNALVIGLTFSEHRGISSLGPSLWILRNHILFDFYDLARVGLDQLLSISWQRKFLLLICPLYFGITLELNSACFALYFDRRHHGFLESLRTIDNDIGAERGCQLEFRQVVLLYRLVLVPWLLWRQAGERGVGTQLFLLFIGCHSLFPVGLAILRILLIIDAVS